MIPEMAVILVAGLAGIVHAIDVFRVRHVGRLLAFQRFLGAVVYFGIAWIWTLRQMGQPWPDIGGGPTAIMRFIVIALALLGAAEVVTRWRRHTHTQESDQAPC